MSKNVESYDASPDSVPVLRKVPLCWLVRPTLSATFDGRELISSARSDTGPGRFSAHQDAVTGGNDASHRFARSRINAKRIVMHALSVFKLAPRLGWIGRFVNISRHI